MHSLALTLTLGVFQLAVVAQNITGFTSCLSSAKVPSTSSGSSVWNAKVAPFNQRLTFTPAALVVATDITHVQGAVRCAAQSGLKVAAKSGGHSYASSGLGGENGHVVVQLDEMYKVKLNSDNTATIQAGARLGHVALELYNQGKRAIAHGTCPGVGISGHALHGGFGFASHIHGLALDWMIGATVVLANGTAVHCSETENADIFWGMRGAGSNIGIAVEYQFKTFEAPSQVTWFNIDLGKAFGTNRTASTDIMMAIQDFVKNDMPSELNFRVYLNSFGNTKALIEAVYFGNLTQAKDAFLPLSKKVPNWNFTVATTGSWIDELTFFSYGQALNQTTPYSQRDNFYSSSLVTQEIPRAGFDAFVNYWMTTNSGRPYYVQMDAHGGKTSAIAKVPGNATAYGHRDKLFLFQFYDINFVGQYPANGFSFLQGYMSSITNTMDASKWGRYINYADTQLDRATATKQYYGENLSRLQALKATYDPKDLFYYPQGVQPKTV